MTDLTKKEKKSRFLPILIIGVFALFLVLPVIAKMIPKQNPDAGLEEKRALEREREKITRDFRTGRGGTDDRDRTDRTDRPAR